MTEPTSPPTYKVTSEEEIEACSVGRRQAPRRADHARRLRPAWPALYAREEARIRSVLGDRVVEIHHTGSTSVPGLAAKPVIDITLVVPDSSDEPAYVPDMEAAGYRPLDPRAGLVRAPCLQGPRHEHQPPRLLAGLPGDRADGRVPRLAADARRRIASSTSETKRELVDADLGLRPELRRREDRGRRGDRGAGRAAAAGRLRPGTAGRRPRREPRIVARVDSRLGGGYRPLHAMSRFFYFRRPA